jgi:tetratricopeptide (TPR) repeat protein
MRSPADKFCGSLTTLMMLWACGCSQLGTRCEIVADEQQDNQRIHEAAEQFDASCNPAQSDTGARSPLDVSREALASGQLDTARDQLKRYVQDQQTDQVNAVSAALLPLRHEQPALALEVATAVVHRFGASGELMRVIGTAHYRRGDYESSQTAFQQSLSLDSANPLTYLLMSFTLEKLGDRQAAEQFFQRGRQLDPQVASRR